MNQYILLIQGNTKSKSTPEEWNRFFAEAQESGLFRGGSEIGDRIVLGDAHSTKSTEHIVGYMRFDSDDKQKILDLLKTHPVVIHGGSAELCELPKS
jgi:hypothetical protein